MRRLCLLVFLCLGLGCAADGDNGQWDEFWKDVRGDNMKMRSERSGLPDQRDRPVQSKSFE